MYAARPIKRPRQSSLIRDGDRGINFSDEFELITNKTSPLTEEEVRPAFRKLWKVLAGAPCEGRVSYQSNKQCVVLTQGGRRRYFTARGWREFLSAITVIGDRSKGLGPYGTTRVLFALARHAQEQGWLNGSLRPVKVWKPTKLQSEIAYERTLRLIDKWTKTKTQAEREIEKLHARARMLAKKNEKAKLRNAADFIMDLKGEE